MKKENGYVMILVLILLGVSSFAVSTTLSYISSGLKASQVNNDVMTEQYSADAALEDAIWYLKTNTEFPNNPGINRESLTPGGTTSVTYPITVNDIDASVTIELPSDLPDTEVTKQWFLDYWLQRSPRWIKTGDTIDYTFTIRNKSWWIFGWPRDVYQLGATLAPGLEYIPGSSSGMTTSDPDIVIESGRQILTWDLDPPYTIPKNSSASQLFDTTANVDGGIYYTTARGNLWSEGEDWFNVNTGPDAPVWVSMYNVTVTAKKITHESCVALTQTGGVIDGVDIFNWEEQ